MTQTTRPPDRLPRLATTPDRGREVRIGIVAALGLTVFVIGVPVALAVFVGYPLPRSAPSREWLTQTVTSTLLIKILACVVWVLWAHFTVCVLAEWRALRRGRLPRDLQFGGSSQALARRLVAAALLLAGAATAFGNVAGSHGQPAPARQVASAVQTPGATTTAAEGAQPIGATAKSQAPEGANSTLKSYVVTPPQGRNHDCLWDIAERTLGDPMRYKEIFALNKDRIQADGGKLVDANLIRPGWQLRLPADAHGPGVHGAHVRAATPAPAVPAPAVPAPAVPAPAVPAPAVPASVVPAPAVPVARDTAHAAVTDLGLTRTGASAVIGSAVTGSATRAVSSGGSSWDSDLLGGGLMLAGIALALSARRGPFGKMGDDELALTATADLGLAQSLDRALRNLAAARAEQRLDLPQPVLAWVSADEVRLALAGGDPSDPPAPWRASDDSTWTCPLADLVDHPQLTATAAPFPGLLCVGRDDAHELFVDFEQAPGLISVGGDDERARDLVTSLAAQAVTCAWSDGAKATLVGFSDGEQLAAIDRHDVTHADTLAGPLDQLEAQQADLVRLQHSLGVDGVLNGRTLRRSAAWAPHFIVLSGPPTPAESQRLQKLAGTGRSQFVVLVVGDLTHAAWRFVVDDQRTLDLGVLGASARAHQLDRNAMLQLIDTLRLAGETARADAPAAALLPADALASTRETPDDVNAASEAVRVQRPAAGQALAAVSLLGPVAVDAPGPLDAEKRDLMTEIVVAVALAPAGIPHIVLRSAIWPRGVSDDVYAAAMRDAVDWLGQDAAGRPALRKADGRWLLGPSVRIDWEELQLAARAARGDGELDALRSGIGLFGGRAFSGTPAGRYGWLAFHRCARDAAVVGTAMARRAATLLAGDGHVDDAEGVLRAGLLLVPTAEPLWRDLLVLAARRGPEPAAALAEEMYGALRAERVWAQPETDALVAQLAPGRRETETA